MRKLLLLLFLIIAVSGLAAQEKSPIPTEKLNWKEYKNIDGKFRLVIPHELQEKTDTFETDLGKLAFHSFFYQAPEKGSTNLFYILSYCDYPENAVHSDSITLLPEFFDATVESAVETVDGTLIYQDEISISGFPGRIWRVDYLGEKAIIKTKAFLVENRFYKIQTISFKENSVNFSSNKFLDSFALLR